LLSFLPIVLCFLFEEIHYFILKNIIQFILKELFLYFKLL
jgi:hypothetical protein